MFKEAASIRSVAVRRLTYVLPFPKRHMYKYACSWFDRIPGEVLRKWPACQDWPYLGRNNQTVYAKIRVGLVDEKTDLYGISVSFDVKLFKGAVQCLQDDIKTIAGNSYPELIERAVLTEARLQVNVEEVSLQSLIVLPAFSQVEKWRTTTHDTEEETTLIEFGSKGEVKVRGSRTAQEDGEVLTSGIDLGNTRFAQGKRSELSVRQHSPVEPHSRSGIQVGFKWKPNCAFSGIDDQKNPFASVFFARVASHTDFTEQVKYLNFLDECQELGVNHVLEQSGDASEMGTVQRTWRESQEPWWKPEALWCRLKSDLRSSILPPIAR